jgi:hypothetical protein
MTAHDWKRIWFVACGTAVVAVPMIQAGHSYRASYWECLAPAFYAAAVGLLIGSILFYKSEPFLSRIGFVVVALAVLWLFLAPVLAE